MRFGKGKEKAAWFLKNWMYVGDAAGGAGNVAAARRVSQDTVDILEHGGFRFMETVMSGDRLGEEGELRKVLGLREGRDMCRCETEQRREDKWGVSGGGCPPVRP